MRIAIVGSGVSGLVAAYRLAPRHAVTVFEAQRRVGGHIHTVPVTGHGAPLAVDTGFIVYNERNYPLFTALLNELGVASQPTTMSFSVRSDRHGLEYNGSTLNQLYIQRRNLVSPGFHGMVRDILRFNREAVTTLTDCSLRFTLQQFLVSGGYGDRFIRDYLLPMGAALWSIPSTLVLQMPAHFFVRFFAQHGMLSVDERPEWRVISGGSQRYQEALSRSFANTIRLAVPVTRIERHTSSVTVNGEHFDQVVLACHADEALAALADPTPQEQDILSALPFHGSDILLHTDTRVLPRNRAAWGAWNVRADADRDAPPVVTYNMSMLQSLPGPITYCVSLNADTLVDHQHVIACLHYRHPVHTIAGMTAQGRWAEISGVARTHYCGAYWGFGFHEDGVRSALNVVSALERTT